MAMDAIQHTLTKGITVAANTAIKKVAGEAALDMIEVSIKNSFQKILISRNTLVKAGYSLSKKASGAAAKGLVKAFEKGPVALAKMAGKVLLKKVAAKAGEKAGEVAVKVAVKVGVKAAATAGTEIAAGAAALGTACAVSAAPTLGVGCLVAAAVEAILLAFQVVSLILDLIDPGHITVLMHRDTIDSVLEATSNQIYNDQKPGAARHYDEEVFFDPMAYMFDIDANGNIVADPVVAAQYNAFQDQYMTSIGIPGDWRSRCTPVPMSLTSEPGVLTQQTLDNIIISTKLNAIVEPPFPSTPLAWSSIILIAFSACFLIVSLLTGPDWFQGTSLVFLVISIFFFLYVYVNKK
jgi:hypothetical protein